MPYRYPEVDLRQMADGPNVALANLANEVLQHRATISALKAQLAAAKREGAAEELERMAGKVGHQFTGTMRFTSADLLERAASLRGGKE